MRRSGNRQAHQTLTNVSSEPLMSTFPDAVSAQQQVLTSSLCPTIFTVLRLAVRSYTKLQLIDAHEERLYHVLTVDVPVPACDDFVTVCRKLATPYAGRVVIPIVPTVLSTMVRNRVAK